MSRRAVKLELRSGDAVVATFELTEATDEVCVGRSHACMFQTPSEDHSVSGKHARVFWKGRTAWIEDCGSRNGVFADGRRLVKPEKLDRKTIYTLGGCRLSVVEEGSAQRKAAAKCHRLEFLTGDREHEVVEIRPRGDSTGGAFTIGLDPANDIVLHELSVSRRHAAFTVKRNGDCWIQDLGSRNGTYVNGEKLSGRERFLHHGDKISIAYFEFRFHDRNVTPPVDWRKLVYVFVILGALLVSAWVVMNGLRPNPATFRALATKLAAEENFAGAHQAVTNAYAAPHGGVEVERTETDTLKRQIAVWSETDSRWTSIREDLAAGRVAVVRPKLESIREPVKWGWNETTAKTKQMDADFTYDLIKRIYAGSDMMKEKDPTAARLGAAIDGIDAYFRTNAAKFAELSYLTAATNNLMTFRRRMQTLKDGIDRIDHAVDSIDRKKPDFTLAIKTLETVIAAKDKLPEGIRAHADALLVTMKKFLETQRWLQREFDFVTGLDFKAVQDCADQLPLPDKDECARHRVFSDARDAFSERHQENQRMAASVAPMVRNLEGEGVGNGAEGSLVAYVTNVQVWEKALTFDCFSGRFPEPSRMDPNGAYDKLFGIECTYENLHQLPKMSGKSNAVRMRFVPQTQKARALFEQVRTFMAALERPESAEFRAGKLGDLYALCGQILDRREKLIAFLRTRRTRGATKGLELTREQIIAGFFAEYFTEDPSYADLRALETAFKQQERQMVQLDESIGAETDPEKRLTVMKKILGTGIPGNSIVRKYWVKLASE